MAQQSREPQTLDIAEDLITDPSLSRNASFSRLNACAPEFVPRLPLPVNHGGHRVENQHHQHQPVVHVIYHHPPPPPPVSPQFVVPSSSHGIYHHHHHNNHEYHEEDVNQATVRPGPAREGLSDEVIHKITKQVEYYFSDANLATTEHLMRFITKDPDGFVPITVIASFKKIKALVHSNSLLAAALRTSSKLVVSEDGKKVRRQQPFTELDVEELQSRIVVAENLPDDHCYQRLMKIFSVVGSVKTIRTCYPQAPNGTAAATNRSSKLDMLFANKLHAFVEYESIEDAEKAVAELNDGRNWRNGLRVRLLSSCMVPPKQGPARGCKPGHEGDGNAEEENASTSDQTKVNHMDQDPSQSAETAHEHVVEEVVVNDKESGTAKRGKGRGRGGKGRGRGGPHHNSSNNNHHVGGGHTIGTPPPSNELPTIVSRQPPGPRMPDGTRGFTIGRGKPLQLHSGQ